ncbi:MAG: aspartate kinase [Parcubacteria group bacterium Gr01-1014_33]|nr:MAG: aspartate kinase [Parcubacteria group bacterium Gr01-1014_33]
MAKKNPITDEGIVVVKFGGTGLVNERIFLAAQRIAALKRKGNDHIVAVVSAQGNTTDELIELAKSINPDPDDRSLALLVSIGEMRSCALLTMALNALGVSAVALTGWQAGIRTNGKGYLDARIAGIDPRAIHALLNQGHIVVITGFQGGFIHDNVPEIALLERGGSDTTAIYIACIIGAYECVLYKDVLGILAAPPDVISDPEVLTTISLGELEETTESGAEVVSAHALAMLRESKCQLVVRPMFSDDLGTFVTLAPEHDRIVSSITFRPEIALVRIIARRRFRTGILNAFTKGHINIYLRERNNFTVGEQDAEKIKNILTDRGKELNITRYSVQTGFVQITIVGEGMRHTPGVLSQIEQILKENAIRSSLCSTGEISVSYVVRKARYKKAMNALYDHFFRNPT